MVVVVVEPAEPELVLIGLWDFDWFDVVVVL